LGCGKKVKKSLVRQNQKKNPRMREKRDPPCGGRSEKVYGSKEIKNRRLLVARKLHIWVAESGKWPEKADL